MLKSLKIVKLPAMELLLNMDGAKKKNFVNFLRLQAIILMAGIDGW